MINNSAVNLAGNFSAKINNSLSKHKIIFSLLFSIIASCMCLFHSGYGDIDNHLIAMIVNQCYGTDNFCIFLNYGLCQIIKFINTLLPYADGYLMICHTLLFVAVAWISYLILDNTDKLWCRLLMFASIIVINNGFNVVDLSNQNFTIQAAAMVAVACVSISFGLRAKHKAVYIVMSAIFVLFGFMLRFNGALLCIPFLALHLAVDYISNTEKRKYIKNLTIMLIIPIIIILGVYTSNKLILENDYKDYVNYNFLRSKITDFEMKSWEEIDTKPEGISENDYLIINDYMTADVERIDKDYLQTIFDAGANKEQYHKISIKDNVSSIFDIIVHLRKYFVIYLFAISLYALISKIGFWRKVEIIFLALGVIANVVYFNFSARYLYRLCVPAILMYAVMLSVVLLIECNNLEKTKVRNGAVLMVTTVTAALLFLTSLISAKAFMPAFLAKSNINDGEYAQYCVDDNLYIWDYAIENTVPFKFYAQQGKLPSQKFLLHNIQQGEYTIGQAFTDEYFDRIGTKNPIRDLVESDNTFYISEEPQLLEKYLQEHYSSKASAVQVDVIADIPVWQFRTKE